MVKENEKFYSDQQLQRAKVARKFLHEVGFPSVKDLKNIIAINRVKNCPIMVGDITLAEKIYGRDINSLKATLNNRNHCQSFKILSMFPRNSINIRKEWIYILIF